MLGMEPSTKQNIITVIFVIFIPLKSSPCNTSAQLCKKSFLINLYPSPKECILPSFL